MHPYEDDEVQVPMAYHIRVTEEAYVQTLPDGSTWVVTKGAHLEQGPDGRYVVLWDDIVNV